jgi:pilus assembly protein CpaF
MNLLRERLTMPGELDALPQDGASGSTRHTRAYQALKMQVHQLLLSRIDLEAMEGLSEERLCEELGQMVERLLTEENLVVNGVERRNLVRDIQHEMLGLGPLEPLLADTSISDILVNGAQQVYVERRGRLERTDISFVDDNHLMKIIDKIVSRVGRRVDESSPMADARLPD